MSMLIHTVNDLVACEPFPLTPQQTVQDNKLGFGPSSTATIIKTKVVLPCTQAAGKPSINVGEYIYIDGRSALEPWAKLIHTVEINKVPVRFILIPLVKLLLVERSQIQIRTAPEPTPVPGQGA